MIMMMPTMMMMMMIVTTMIGDNLCFKIMIAYLSKRNIFRVNFNYRAKSLSYTKSFAYSSIRTYVLIAIVCAYWQIYLFYSFINWVGWCLENYVYFKILCCLRCCLLCYVLCCVVLCFVCGLKIFNLRGSLCQFLWCD